MNKTLFVLLLFLSSYSHATIWFTTGFCTQLEERNKLLEGIVGRCEIVRLDKKLNCNLFNLETRAVTSQFKFDIQKIDSSRIDAKNKSAYVEIDLDNLKIEFVFKPTTSSGPFKFCKGSIHFDIQKSNKGRVKA